MNAEYKWAMSEEFETLLPTLDARREMDALDQRYGAGQAVASDGPSSIHDLLVGLWAWAKGVLVPYEHGLD